MTPTPNRSGWRAALIGVSRYTHPDLPDIPAAANNITDLAQLLTAHTGGALADNHCTVLLNPNQPTQVGAAVSIATKEADDVLLLYYTGHGVLDRGGRLHLALPDSDPDQIAWSSIPFETLREELTTSRARARILILDCCFSGRAFEAMSSPATLVEGQIDIHGTYTITSSAKNEPSLAPEGHRHTAFTAALLNAAESTGLTLNQLYLRIDQILTRNGHPRPHRRTVDIAGELRLFTPPGLGPISGDDALIAPTIDSLASPDSDTETLFASGRQFADNGDRSQAESSWRRAASQGHSGAMNNLANLLCAQRQFREAHLWYREAAERGNITAMGNLANLLHEVQQHEDAERWWRRAAKAGDTDAMYNLAITLDKSLHVDDAITWYRQAAEAGHPDAMHNLAIRLRYRGQLTEATVWWQRAGHQRPQRRNEKPRRAASRKESR